MYLKSCCIQNTSLNETENQGTVEEASRRDTRTAALLAECVKKKGREKHQRTDIKVQYSQGRARAFIARAEDLPLYQPNERGRGEALPTKHLSSISPHSSTQRAGLPELTDTLSTPSH